MHPLFVEDILRQQNHCKRLIAMHKGFEREYRKTDNRHMIRYCKAKIKNYQSDLGYYERQLELLSA